MLVSRSLALCCLFDMFCFISHCLIFTGMILCWETLSTLSRELITTNQYYGRYVSTEGSSSKHSASTLLAFGNPQRTLWWFDGLFTVSLVVLGRLVDGLMALQSINSIRTGRFMNTKLITSPLTHLQSFKCSMLRSLLKPLAAAPHRSQRIFHHHGWKHISIVYVM